MDFLGIYSLICSSSYNDYVAKQQAINTIRQVDARDQQRVFIQEELDDERFNEVNLHRGIISDPALGQIFDTYV